MRSNTETAASIRKAFEITVGPEAHQRAGNNPDPKGSAGSIEKVVSSSEPAGAVNPGQVHRPVRRAVAQGPP